MTPTGERPATVLVLDGLQRKSLAIVRSLGTAGHRVLTAETTFWSLCRFSRFAARSFVYPSPATDEARFWSWLERLAAREAVDAVFPTDDATTAALVAHGSALKGLTGLLVPPQSSFAALRDKASAAAWLERARVPHPRTLAIQSLEAVPQAARELGLPLVIKPRRSSGARGVRFVRRGDDVGRLYLAVHREYPWPILQQYIAPGPKYHVCLLYDQQNRVVARFVQRELRQYPYRGGTSTMQESVDRPDLCRLVEPVFAELPWSGPVQADLMEDGETGEPYVLEINPRYWSSLHLALVAGVDFARLQLALAQGARLAEAPRGRIGVRGRSLLPSDLLAYLDDPGRADWEPPFFCFRAPDTFDDLLSATDPGPTLGFCLAVARYACDRRMWSAVLRRERR